MEQECKVRWAVHHLVGGFKHGFILVIAASFFATFLVVNPTTSTTVGACGWSIENYGPTGSAQVWDSNAGVYTWLNFRIDTYSDGCGSKFYRLWEWVGDGTAASNLHFDLRVWVCGSYQQTFTGDLYWVSSGYLDSNSYFYGVCGRQADDYGSAIGNTYWFSPTYGDAYVTAG